MDFPASPGGGSAQDDMQLTRLARAAPPSYASRHHTGNLSAAPAHGCQQDLSVKNTSSYVSDSDRC
jgi:hypothetical protein